MPLHTERELADYILTAIDNNYLITMIITSYTQGKLKSQNLPFGMGKTTLEFWINNLTNKKGWDYSFDTTKYNPYDFMCLMDPELRRKEGRLNCACFDDMQATCPAEQGVPRAIRRMASYLTTNRPEIACIVGTADNINSVSAPLRKLFVFELIVAERGVYEVQKITYHKNYKKPLKDLGKLDYLEEGTFPRLPDEVQKRYEVWRCAEKVKLYPALKAELHAYAKLKEWGPNDIEDGVVSLDIPVTKNGRDYVLTLPQVLGEKLHRQELHVALATK
jgi:hypothetical protein